MLSEENAEIKELSRTRRPYNLFEAYGIELEYMLVDSQTLNVVPRVDEILSAESGAGPDDVERGSIVWSNELVSHVMEFKVAEPVKNFDGLAEAFQDSINAASVHAEKIGCMLMPTAAHPWMDPKTETKMWQHDCSELYAAYNKVFDCNSHGWANLQSCHINLPFGDDAEFGKLHAAIRLLLPILPAIAASSPFLDGQNTGLLDSRLEIYRKNSRKVPACIGKVIPEAVFSRDDYEDQILKPIYRDMEKVDPSGIMSDEFSNARGAIARFSRMAIEIRLIDVQECPRMDLAIAALVRQALMALADQKWTEFERQSSWQPEQLLEILLQNIKTAHQTKIPNPEYLRCFGVSSSEPISANQLWREILEASWPRDHDTMLRSDAELLIDQGPLAQRILAATGEAPSREALSKVYRNLSECLHKGTPFQPD